MDNYRKLMSSISAKDSQSFKKYLLLDDTSLNHIDMCNGVLHLACELQVEDIVDILLADSRLDYDKYFKNASHNPLDRACWKGNVSMVKKFLSINPQWINLINAEGQTPLYKAIKHEKFELFNVLLQYSDCLIDKTETFPKDTPLILAVKQGYLDVANQLLDKGADINKALKYHKNSLLIDVIENKDSYCHQITRNYQTTLNFILSKNIDINYQNENGDTALHRACIYNDNQTALELLKKGANLFLKNDDNETPLDLAQNHNELLVLFEKYQLENTVPETNNIGKQKLKL